MISKTGMYVIRALSELAKQPDDAWVGTAILAQEIGAPVNYLGKLLHILARERVVLSQKGVRGGVRLARPAHEVALYDALEPFENFSRWSESLLGPDAHPNGPQCQTNARWAAVRDQVLQFLKETTAADLVAAESPAPGAPPQTPSR